MPAELLTPAGEVEARSQPAPFPPEAWWLAGTYGAAVFAGWAGQGFEFGGNVSSGVLTAGVLGVLTLFVLRGGLNAVIVVALGYTLAALGALGQLIQAKGSLEQAAAFALATAFGISLVLLYRLRHSPWFAWRRHHRGHRQPGVRQVVATVVVLAACAGVIGAPPTAGREAVARDEATSTMRRALLNDEPGLHEQLKARGDPATLSRAELEAAVTAWVEANGLRVRRVRVFPSVRDKNGRVLPAAYVRTFSPADTGVAQNFCAWGLDSRNFGLYTTSCRSVVPDPHRARKLER